jgi:predicted phosphodiesterase
VCSFVAISDTHNAAHECEVAAADVLLHCGDFTCHSGDEDPAREVMRFVDWLKSLPHRQKIVIAGNHDLSMDERPSLRGRFRPDLKALLTNDAAVAAGIVYLEGGSCVTWRGGFQVWGSPISIRNMGSFSRRPGPALAAEWARIPAGVDVVMTHGPALGHGDLEPASGEHLGCEQLLRELTERVRPAVAVCGHIHAARGVSVAKWCDSCELEGGVPQAGGKVFDTSDDPPCATRADIGTVSCEVDRNDASSPRNPKHGSVAPAPCCRRESNPGAITFINASIHGEQKCGISFTLRRLPASSAACPRCATGGPALDVGASSTVGADRMLAEGAESDPCGSAAGVPQRSGSGVSVDERAGDFPADTGFLRLGDGRGAVVAATSASDCADP